MSFIDTLIIIIFLTATVIFGLMQRKYNRSTDDYFLADRKLPWWMSMFSIVATETSVLTFISVPGLAYRGDWSFLQLAMGYILGRILVARFLLPGYYRSGVTSIYETLNEKFGLVIQRSASLLFLITRVLADGVRFLATAAIVQVITGWSITASVLVIGMVTLIYTFSGGIRAVVWIDSFQFILYLSGAIISILFIVMTVDSSAISFLTNALDNGRLTIFHFDGNIFLTPLNFFSAFIGGALLSFASHGADYLMVQRVLGCKNLSHAKKAMVGSGIFVFIQFTLFLLAGTLLFHFMDGAVLEKDREFSTFIVNYLPVGLRGVLLAGVLSAAMSTLSSSMNALASSTVMDWLKKRATLKLSQFVSLFWAGVLMTVALLFDESNSAVVIVGLKIASYTYGGLLSLFILAKIPYSIHRLAVLTGLVVSVAIVFLLQNLGIAWTWFIGISVLTNLITVAVMQTIIRHFFDD